MSSFDISKIQVEDTFEVEIKHPKTDEPIIVGGQEVVDPETGEKSMVGGVPMTVTVYGPASAQFKAAQAVQNTKFTKRLRAGVEQSAETEATDKAAFLSACTVSLNGFNYKGQTEGRETFRSLYLDRKMGWLTDQVNRQMGDWGNFTKAVPSS